jgi:hypothetical protein
VRGLYEDVLVERQEDDDSFWVIARFVTVSVDVHSAVVAVTRRCPAGRRRGVGVGLALTATARGWGLQPSSSIAA